MAQTEEALLPQTLSTMEGNTHACTPNRNTPTHVLTLTAFLTSAHRQTRKTHNKKSEIILQSKGEKTRQTVASVNDRGG